MARDAESRKMMNTTDGGRRSFTFLLHSSQFVDLICYHKYHMIMNQKQYSVGAMKFAEDRIFGLLQAPAPACVGISRNRYERVCVLRTFPRKENS